MIGTGGAEKFIHVTIIPANNVVPEVGPPEILNSTRITLRHDLRVVLIR